MGSFLPLRIGWLAVLAACSGVSPLPAELAARRLPAADPGIDRAAVAAAESEALSQLSQRRPAAAATAARSVLELDPRSARGRAVLGLALLQQSKAQDPPDRNLQNEGDGESQTAVLLAPGDPVVGLLRGRVLAEIGHLTAAALAAEDCLSRSAPSDAADRVELLAAAGEWCCELGEEQRALVHLLELEQHRSDDPIVHFRLGICLLRTAGEPAAAIAASRAFARCAELAPADDDAHLAVVAAQVRAAELWRAAGNDGEVRAWLEHAAAAAAGIGEKFPALAEPQYRLGVVAELRADADGARAAYRRALERDPDHLGALLNLAGLMTGADVTNLTPARELWRRALAVDARSGGLTDSERRRLRELADDPSPRSAVPIDPSRDQAPRML